jgi:CRISPR/Cas system-associated exonuclease Cas4 (RecB family)
MSIVKNLGFKVKQGALDINKLSKIIEDAYSTYNRSTDKQKTSFAPSTIGYGHGKCPRYWYIAFDGATFVETNEPASWATMFSGIASHERLGELLERSQLTVTNIELEFVHDDPPIRGFIDVTIDRNGDEVIGEIKTTRTEAFRARRAKMTPPDYHLIQILIYMYLRKAESGFFLYEDKNDHSILVMPVYMDDANRELVEYVLEWMRTVKQSWEDRKLPENPYRSNAKECKGCPVRDTCFDAEIYGQGDVKIGPLRLLQPAVSKKNA